MDAALGFRVHTGWAAAVVLAGPASAMRVVDRRRFTLVDKTDHDSVFVYHAAVEVDLTAAETLLATASEIAVRSARREMTQLLSDLAAAGHSLGAVGLPMGADRTLPGVGDILRSHSLIHTAEGALFRRALADACASLGLAVVAVASRDVDRQAARATGLRPDAIKRRVVGLGRGLGPPWGADQKEAALAAVVAMAEAATQHPGSGRSSRAPR